MDADLFSEGSIYFYENKTNTKKDYENPDVNHDFIVSRPVFVIKNRELPFDTFTINVLVITSSSHRVGIPISIDGYKTGKVLPYAIHSVHKENLVQYMGRASDEIISEVRDAIRFHEGYTDTKPKYLIEYEERVKQEEMMLNKMSLKEKGAYLFLKERCNVNSSYMVSYDELFSSYQKHTNGNGYTRSQDFSKVLTKYIKNFNNVSIQTKNKVKIVFGMSVIGNTHRQSDTIDSLQSVKASKDIVKNKTFENTGDNLSLYESLSLKAKKAYDKLDIIQKLDMCQTQPEDLSINGVSTEADRRTIKKMILNDIAERRDKLFDRLDNGDSPLSMKTTDQYVLYICSNTQLKNHVKPYFLKTGGVSRLKKEIRKNIKHHFSKLK